MTSIHDLPEVQQSRLRAELRPSEQVLWAGQPLPNRYMRSGFVAALFFIPWTAFSVFWIAGASGFKLPRFDGEAGLFPLLFPLFGLPFLLIGLGGLAAPLLLRRKAAFIVYALTEQRALLIEGSKAVTVQSIALKDIHNLVRTELADGSGTLLLQTDAYRGVTRTASLDADASALQSFVAVPEVRLLHQLLEQAIERARL